MKQRDGELIYPPPLSTPYDNGEIQSESTPNPSSFSTISPILLLVIVVLAVIFFISGLLHLLVRFLLKRSATPSIHHSNRNPEISGSQTLQRQLQQLFRLHDSGLDQTSIDALPVFCYEDIMGLKEPFDCAVCLCEFSSEDKLRLLPICSHAFHISCIDTWLLSNSTCPLCRATLLRSSFSLENPRFNFNQNPRPENVFSLRREMAEENERKLFSVRLGKFRKINSEEEDEEEEEKKEKGESSTHDLDTRRCYSMGTYRYIVADSDLQVASSNRNGFVKERESTENFPGNLDMEGKKISGKVKGESFSVSKIWLWSKKSRYSIPSSSNTLMEMPNLRSHNFDL